MFLFDDWNEHRENGLRPIRNPLAALEQKEFEKKKINLVELLDNVLQGQPYYKHMYSDGLKTFVKSYVKLFLMI